ncbi:MAG: PIN domain-containing protein [Cyanobacteria bacterium J06639_16]
MQKIFIDTSAFAALADSRDDNHHNAVQFNQSTKGISLFTSNYVLDELYTLLRLNVGYPRTVHFKTKLDQLTESGILTIIWITKDLATQTWQVFEKFNTDKHWSLTDCSSHVVMKTQNITDVFAFDHHFSQMGFVLKGGSTSSK